MPKNPQMSIEEESALLSQAIGEAITEWSALEVALALLFSTVATGNHSNVNAQVIFYSIESLYGKLKAIDALLQGPLVDADLRMRWAKLQASIIDRAKTRNRIAHHNRLEDDTQKPGRRMRVIDPMLSAKVQKDMKGMSFMCIDDITSWFPVVKATVQDVLALQRDFESFQKTRLTQHQPPQPAS